MLESLIVATAESVIISCGKSIYQRVSLCLKKRKIKNALKEKIESDILKKHGDMTYYNSLDAFLVSEDFANKLMSHCFQPGALPFKSINAYLIYLSEKFVDNYPVHFVEKSYIYQDLYSLSKLVFDIVNDYSKDETARLVISQLKEVFSEQYTLLSEQNEKVLAFLKERLPLPEEDNIANFKDKATISLFKSSLTTQYICQSQYINRNIYTENDIAQSSVECLLRDKRIILLGDPGSGKTYESINVLKQLCTNAIFEDYIPIYIKLMEYGIVFDSIFDFIKCQLRPYYGELTDEQLIRELSTDKFVIILDGVDEILDASARIKFFADINQMINTTGAYYFITSRINPYHNNIKNVIEYRIKDLTQEQIRNELQKNGVRTSYSRQYYELFANPLFLQIGINVLKNTSGKVYNKSQLFSAYIEEVCYKRDLNKQLPKAIFKNYHNILMSIGQLAFDTFEKPCLSVAEFDEFFGVNNKDFTTNNVCDIFRIDIFKVGNNISFSHKQFKEFFAAYYLVKKYDVLQDRETYLELMNSENWQEVMIFAAGMITDIDDQNMFLDMMLSINLKTYIQCVKHKNDLSAAYEKLSHEEYSNKYLETIYKSYTLLIETYFQNINTQFEPFKIKTEGADINKKVVVVTAFCIESISEKAVGFLSNFITIVITIIIFFYTINNEKREDYKLAKKNAAILAQSLNSIMTQITLINNGERFSVIYPSEILDYYRQCSVYLKYEYLEPIMSELSFVNRINACIERNDEEQAQRLIEHRRKCLSRWNDDFNIIEVSSNLRAFSLEQDEQKPWKEQKQYKEFDEFILSNYEKRIKKLTVKRLKEMDGKCEESVMADYIAEQLSKEIEKKNPELTKPLYEKRALTKAIYKIYLTLEEDEDGFKMCWGILSLSKE